MIRVSKPLLALYSAIIVWCILIIFIIMHPTSLSSPGNAITLSWIDGGFITLRLQQRAPSASHQISPSYAFLYQEARQIARFSLVFCPPLWCCSRLFLSFITIYLALPNLKSITSWQNCQQKDSRHLVLSILLLIIGFYYQYLRQNLTNSQKHRLNKNSDPHRREIWLKIGFKLLK